MDCLDVLASRSNTPTADSNEPDFTTSYHEPSTIWARTVDDVRRTASGTVSAGPSSHAPQSASGEPAVRHTVKPGETLSELAARYGLKVHDLIAANPSVQNPDLLRGGETLSVPLDEIGGRRPGLHAVLPGENAGTDRGPLSQQRFPDCRRERYRRSQSYPNGRPYLDPWCRWPTSDNQRHANA
jgi:LysM repeat protein